VSNDEIISETHRILYSSDVTSQDQEHRHYKFPSSNMQSLVSLLILKSVLKLSELIFFVHSNYTHLQE